MTAKHIMDARARASKKYKLVHADLALSLKRSEAAKAGAADTSHKQRRHRLRSEYWREYAEALC